MSTNPHVDPTQTAVFGAVHTGEIDVSHLNLREDARTAVEALPAGSALLVVRRGPNVGARFLLDSPRVTIGRKPSSDIFLDDVTVSRKHAEFSAQPGGGYAVRDLGSLNGTYVNRERVEEVGLVSGDEVQIGKFRMTYYPSLQGFAQ
ncbi:FHA domain-containing protein [Nanchangia anserum]|uniref:FHA domain-containing protein n=1 Tax=Nanchangia anserum TaxID=2692125 RepID=A0A8I0KVD1_9ACTO|nr:FHA domain-containing protein [Nanchangia anserum]MBD3688809.1 FHA domain-containing protein [Nanchangia anserum]QOX82607.1 FHA domain-containing protein [Nanchangia anserum]